MPDLSGALSGVLALYFSAHAQQSRNAFLFGCLGRQSCGHLGQDLFGLCGIEIGLVALFDPMIGQKMVLCRRNAVTRKATANAGKRATVNSNDRAAGLGKAHQLWHVTTDARDAGHFGKATPVQPDRDVICHLRRAGTARAGIDQRQIGA